MRRQRETAEQVRDRFERVAQEKEARAVKKFARRYFSGVEKGTEKNIHPEKEFVRKDKLVLIKK